MDMYNEVDAFEIGQNLIELRNGKSQASVAKDLKISVSALSMYERGERIPRDPVKVRISNYYNRPIESIFFAKNNHVS